MYWLNLIHKSRIKNADGSAMAQGFTLVEMIVALGIFTLVAVVAIGAFLKIIDANKKSQSLKTAVNNLNFAMEAMSRELRVGYNYYCTGASAVITKNYSSSGCIDQPLIAFRSSKKGTGAGGVTCNLIYAYRYNSAARTLEKAEQPDCDTSIPSVNAPFIPVVSSELNVESLKFSARAQKFSSSKGGGVADAQQAWARVVVKASAGLRAADKVEYNLESFISQRLIR